MQGSWEKALLLLLFSRPAEERVEVVNLAKEVASSREISLTLLIYFCDCKMINIVVPIPYF